MSNDPVFSPRATRVRLETLAGQARYSRGWDIWKARHVRIVDRRPSRARGVVDGSQPYLVDVAVLGNGEFVGSCNCPDFAGGSVSLCKHGVAVVLELAAIERHEAEVAKLLPKNVEPVLRTLVPFQEPKGAYAIISEAGRPELVAGIHVVEAIPQRWHAHFTNGALYVWARNDRRGPTELVATVFGDVTRHPYAAPVQVVGGMVMELGVTEARPVEAVVDVDDGELCERYLVPTIVLAAAKATTLLAAMVADPRIELADDALCLAAIAMGEVDIRGPRTLTNVDRRAHSANVLTLWTLSGAAGTETVSQFETFIGRGFDQILATRVRSIADFGALAILRAPDSYNATPTAGTAIPQFGWSLEIAVVDPDGVRTSTGDGEIDRLDMTPRTQALRVAARRCARAANIDSQVVLGGPVVMDLDQVLALVNATVELETAGIRLQVPTGLPKPAKFAASVSIGSDRPSMLGLNAVCDFAWRVHADGSELSTADLEAIASAKAKVVAIDGRWVTATGADLTALRKLLGATTATQALQLAAGVMDTGDVALETVSLHGWLEHLAHIDERVEPVEKPEALEVELYEHQRDALAWLAFLNRCGIGGILADDMGLGKTVSILSLIAHDQQTNGKLGPTLVVAPTSVVAVWAREAERHAPGLSVHVHHGSKRLVGRAFVARADEVDLVVTNYDTMVRDRESLEAITWRRVIADEAQAAKNPRSRRAMALRAIPAHQKICVTGTPIENGLIDLWSLAALAMPGLLGSVEQFRNRFAKPIQLEDDEDAAETLVALLEPFLLARRKMDTDVGRSLPPLVESDTAIELTVEQQALYDTVVEQTLQDLSGRTGIARRGVILALLVRLKQIVNHPEAYLRDGRPLAGRSGKFAHLETVVGDAFAQEQRVLVFSQFVGTAELIVRHLEDLHGAGTSELLCGATSTNDREDLVRRFGTVGGPRVMVVSLKAGGVGLTLTAATRVVLFDRWWNPAVEDQAIARAHRIGQTKTVVVDKLVTTGTIESKIAELLATKRSYAAKVLGVDGDVAGRLAELDTDALRSVLARSLS